LKGKKEPLKLLNKIELKFNLIFRLY